MGPCLCGDPACGACFPGGQVAVKCTSCDWTGKQCDTGGAVGYIPDGYGGMEESVKDDGCPKCGADVQPVDGPDDDPEGGE